MKKITLALISTLYFGISCVACSPKDGEYSTQAIIKERNKKISDLTQGNLNSFLENIPEGFEEEHGFMSRSEFAKATAGPIYTIMGMDKDGKVFPANLFNIPVIVDGEYRAMITVSYTNGIYEIETVGAALLAAELHILEKERKPEPDFEKIILNVYSKSSGFVGYQDMNKSIEQINFIPLTSAKVALNTSAQSVVLKQEYKLSEVKQLVVAEY